LPGRVTLRDIAADGRVLVNRDSRRLEMSALLPGEVAEREISWLDWSRLVDISPDGGLILFDESGTAAGGKYVSYLYRAADHSVLRLGDGLAMGLTPDATGALVLRDDDRTRLRILPMNGGEAQDLAPSGLEYQWARFFPDGQTLVALGSEPGGPLRLYRVPPSGEKPAAISPPTVARNVAISPGGRYIAALSAGELIIYPTDGSAPARVVPVADPMAPILWASPDLLYAQRQRSFGEIPAPVFRLNPASGASQPWKEILPRDPVGVNAVTRIVIAANGRSYAYSSRRVLSELLTVEGWR
jgi:hypothetical protein